MPKANGDPSSRTAIKRGSLGTPKPTWKSSVPNSLRRLLGAENVTRKIYILPGNVPEDGPLHFPAKASLQKHAYPKQISQEVTADIICSRILTPEYRDRFAMDSLRTTDRAAYRTYGSAHDYAQDAVYFYAQQRYSKTTVWSSGHGNDGLLTWLGDFVLEFPILLTNFLFLIPPDSTFADKYFLGHLNGFGKVLASCQGYW
ncbi:uncharacterized protein BT62DRAFT_915608 [Guyanagaster necrorhizus]|uniref:Uncharacterized protein n=1 Tax=Guyanagaster necrorhizus TaxID=856835 RepID=A0A9P7W449_9AGAR|nr:uncharacterized protein BT62DRAFT_915608 [Guyanagaster necrorhizus MCA 3950]KAG7451769.1 hypothetical protein BT62DRAFT_915608 [Guyanagaster necrorhizus MCA 3950]